MDMPETRSTPPASTSPIGLPAPQTAPPAHRRIARNVATNWLWYGLVVVSGFIVPRCIDAFHGQRLLGVWDFSWSLVFYLDLLSLGVVSAVNRHVARHRARDEWDELSVVVNSCLGLASGSLLLGLGLVAAFVVWVPGLLATADAAVVHTARSVVVLLGLSAALRLPLGVFGGIITGSERFDLLNAVRGARDLAQLLGLIAALLLGGGLVALAAVVLVVELLGSLALVVMATRLCPRLRLSPHLLRLSTARQMLVFGTKSMAIDLARGGLYHTNSLLLAYFLGPAALAVYARQRALVLHTMRFLKQYAQVFIPTSSALHATGNLTELQALMIQSCRLGFYTTLPIVVLLLTMGRPLLQLWMGDAYAAPLVLAILAAGHVLSLAQHSAYSLLMGMGRHGLPAVFELLAAACSVGFGALALGPLGWGMTGAALAVAVPVTLSGGVILPALALRRLGLSPWQYARRVLPGPIAAAVPFAACLLAARLLWPATPLLALAAGAATGGAILAACYWRWVVPEASRASLVARLRSALSSAAAALSMFRPFGQLPPEQAAHSDPDR